MGAKKKKASGNAAAGEKVFKSLCGVCHSLSVSSHFLTPKKPHSFLLFFRQKYPVFLTFVAFLWFLVELGRTCPGRSARTKYCIKWGLCVLVSLIVEGHDQVDGRKLGQVVEVAVWVRPRKRDGFRRHCKPKGSRRSDRLPQGRLNLKL